MALARDGARQQRQVDRFAEIHHTLRQDNATKAADAVLRVLDGSRASEVA
jgi:hypothetical protein